MTELLTEIEKILLKDDTFARSLKMKLARYRFEQGAGGGQRWGAFTSRLLYLLLRELLTECTSICEKMGPNYLIN